MARAPLAEPIFSAERKLAAENIELEKFDVKGAGQAGAGSSALAIREMADRGNFVDLRRLTVMVMEFGLLEG